MTSNGNLGQLSDGTERLKEIHKKLANVEAFGGGKEVVVSEARQAIAEIISERTGQDPISLQHEALDIRVW